MRLPTLRVLSILALACAGFSLYASRRRVPLIAGVALVLVGLLAFAAKSDLPAAVHRFLVEPQQLARERTHVDHAIAFTRRAYGLDRVRLRVLPAESELSGAEIAGARRTIENVPLWDESVLRPAVRDLQSIGRYYTFPSLSVDRYTINGEPMVMSVGARQLSLRRLGPGDRSWATDRFAYTHGYGVVAVHGGDADRDRYPRFAQQGFRADANPLGVQQPRIYFGEQAAANPPYVVLNTRRAEVDEPISGDHAPGYHYDGSGGIAISDPLRRLAFAARFGDLDLLLSETVTRRSRILLHRNGVERLRTVAPFLRWDPRPQTAVIDGRVQFLFDGYTTSDSYPYSAPVQLGGEQVNYVRAAARADGRRFQRSREHLRRLRRSDPARVAGGLSRPVPRVVADADRAASAPALSAASCSSRRPTPTRPTTPKTRPRSGTARTPGRARCSWPDRWSTPARSTSRIRGRSRRTRGACSPHTEWRACRATRASASCSRRRSPHAGARTLSPTSRASLDARGRTELTLLSLPRDRLPVGPSQATRRMLSSAGVVRRLQLLNRESRDLGKSGVSRTVLGVPRVVPIAGTLVYVQPLFLTTGGEGVPRLQLVTAFANGRVGYGRDLAAALRRIQAPVDARGADQLGGAAGRSDADSSGR